MKNIILFTAILVTTLFGFNYSKGGAVVDTEEGTFGVVPKIGKYAPRTISGEDVADAATGYAVEAASIPTAVSVASATGVTASTGTAISSLSGAAATSATLAATGSAVIEGAAVVGVTITAAPAAVGAAVITGTAGLVYWGVKKLFE